MKRRSNFAWLAAGMALVSCGGQSEAPANEAVAEPPANVAAPAANAVAAAPAPVPAPPTYALAGNGLAPGLTFGMQQAEAVRAATAAFGEPTRREHNDECGEGPMDFVSYRGLQLGFQEGRLAGWSLSGPDPALRTAGGLAIGAPRSVLGNAEVEDSTLGPEFAIDEVGGLLDESRTRVEALWAGQPCQFR